MKSKLFTYKCDCCEKTESKQFDVLPTRWTEGQWVPHIGIARSPMFQLCETCWPYNMSEESEEISKKTFLKLLHFWKRK